MPSEASSFRALAENVMEILQKLWFQTFFLLDPYSHMLFSCLSKLVIRSGVLLSVLTNLRSKWWTLSGSSITRYSIILIHGKHSRIQLQMQWLDLFGCRGLLWILNLQIGFDWKHAHRLTPAQMTCESCWFASLVSIIHLLSKLLFKMLVKLVCRS